MSGKKGFTLVELLVAIVIVGLLGSIGVVGFRTFFKTAEDRYYEVIESNVLLAGNDYYLDHRELLPIGNEYEEVTLDNLIEGKYIDPIKDNDGNICTEGSVISYREDNQFKYEACIKCGDYSSTGKYCESAISKRITVSAKTARNKFPYDVDKSYASVGYVDNEDVNVTFSMNPTYTVTKYRAVNIKTGYEEECSPTSGNTCTVGINSSGTYKVMSYDKNREQMSSKYINIKIAKNGSAFSLTGDTKYTLSKADCNGTKKKNIVINVVPANPNEEYKTIEYRRSDGVNPLVIKESSSLVINDELAGGHYDIEVVVTNHANNYSIKRMSIDVAHVIDILYEDDNTTGTHEVLKGQNYNYYSALPATKLSYGQNLGIRWFKNDVAMSATDIVTDSCTYTIVGKTAIPVQVESFATYCKEGLIYTGSAQDLTKAAPSNVTFIGDNGSLKGTNAGTYHINAHIETPQYVWSDGTTMDKGFDCSIGQAPAVITCSNPNYTGSSLTIASCSGGTLSNHTRTAAGSQTVTCTGDSNHTTVTKDCSVNKVAAVITCSNPNYTGSSLTIASCSGGTLSNHTRTAAGSQTVTCTGDSNHTTVTKDCSVNKVAATISCSNKTYNGSNQVACSCSGGTIGGTYQATNAGTYSASCTGDSNHSNPSNVSWTISPIAPTINCSSPTYNGSSVTIASCNGSITLNATGTNAGSYTVKCKGTGNYAVETSKSCSINKAPATPSCSNKTYNGSNQVACSCAYGTIGGTYQATSAGTYTAKCTPNSTYSSNYYESTASWTMAKVAATISCSNKTYNGSNQVACSCSGGTIGGTYQATNAGTYSASCTGDANHTNPSNVSWTINKAAAVPSCSNKSYNGSNQVACSCAYGTIGGTYQATNAGSYTAKCTPNSTYSPNYYESTASWTMAKVAATISCSNKTYNGSNQVACSCSGGTIGGTYQATNAGTYYASCTGDSNHTNPSNKAWTIGPIAPTINCSSPTYNGSSVTIATCTNGSITSNATGTNAGSYTVVCKGTGNYAATATKSCSINPKQPDLSCGNPTYTGYSITIAYCSNGTISQNASATNAGSYTVKCKGTGNFAAEVSKSCSIKPDKPTITCLSPTYSGSIVTIAKCTNGSISSNATGTNAGSYTVVCKGTGNYANEASKSCSIGKKAIGSCTAGATRTYNGSSQSSGVTCPTGASASGTTSATNAGSYTVTCTGSGNYTGSCTSSWKINPTTPTITCSSPTYTGSAIVIATCKNGSITANEKATNAGSYTVKCKGTGNFAAEASKSCSIGKKAIGSCAAGATRTYNGSSQTSGVTCPTGSSASGTTSATNAGSYTVTCTGSGNYSGSCKSSWKINPKAIGSCSAGATRTYNGSSQNSGVTCPTGASASGTTSATNAGSYTVTCTGSGNYSGSCTSSWKINQATPTLTFSATSGDVIKDNKITFTVKANVKGTFSLKTVPSTVTATLSKTSAVAANTNVTVTVTGKTKSAAKNIVVQFAPESSNYKTTTGNYAARVCTWSMSTAYTSKKCSTAQSASCDANGKGNTFCCMSNCQKNGYIHNTTCTKSCP